LGIVVDLRRFRAEHYRFKWIAKFINCGGNALPLQDFVVYIMKLIIKYKSQKIQICGDVGVEHLPHNLQIITEISIRKCSTLLAITDNLSLRFGDCR
jgi:hypothetical protein